MATGGHANLEAGGRRGLLVTTDLFFGVIKYEMEIIGAESREQKSSNNNHCPTCLVA